MYFVASGVSYSMLSLLVDAYEHTPTDGGKPTQDQVSDYIHQTKRFKNNEFELDVQTNGQVDMPVGWVTVRDGKLISFEQ